MPKRRTLEQAEKQIASLVEENRKLAEELEELRRQDIALEGAASQAVSSRTAAEKEVIEFKTRLESAQKQVSELQQTSSALAAQVSRLTREVEKNPLNPLSVEEASSEAAPDGKSAAGARPGKPPWPALRRGAARTAMSCP